jgi:hypothetical protein
MVAVIQLLLGLGMIVSHQIPLLGQMICGLQPNRGAVLGPLKERKARLEKKSTLRQEKKQGEVAAVAAEDLQQLSLQYKTWISILNKSRNAEHEQSIMLGKLLYADDPICKDYYTIDRLGIVNAWDKIAKKLVFAICCSTADELSEQEHDSFSSQFRHLHNDSKLCAAITNNGA